MSADWTEAELRALVGPAGDPAVTVLGDDLHAVGRSVFVRFGELAVDGLIRLVGTLGVAGIDGGVYGIGGCVFHTK